MRVSLEYPRYNENRYAKPWIACVESWPVGGRPVYRFGTFVGRHGDAGEVEIDAKPGDIIASGQKDLRGNNTERHFFVVQDDGTLKEVSSTDARHAIFKKTESEHV